MRRFVPLLLAAGLALVVFAIATLVRSMEAREEAGARAATILSPSARVEEPPIALELPRVTERAVVHEREDGARNADELLLPADHVRVRFRVVERDGGKPLVGAKLGVFPRWWDVLGETDARGEVELVLEGTEERRTFVVTCPHHAEARVDAVTSTQVSTPVVIELDRNVAVLGRIVDREHVPVPGADVVLSMTTVPRAPGFDVEEMASGGRIVRWSSVTTDAQGRFRFEGVEWRAALVLQAQSTGRGVARVELGQHEVEADVDAGEVVLHEPFTLRGSVVSVWRDDPNAIGEPLGHVEVKLEQRFPGQFVAQGGRRIEADHRVLFSTPSGEFAFDGLMPGRYRLTASRPEPDERHQRTGPMGGREAIARQNASPVVVDLLAPEAEPARIVFSRTASLRGVVVDAEHRAAPNVDVAVVQGSSSSHATTSAEGRFEVKGLDRTAARLVARPSQLTGGVLPETVLDGIVPGGPDVLVVLEAAEFVEGRVVDDGLRPVAFAGVTARSSTGAELDFAYTDAEGRFRLRVPLGEAVDLEACPSRMKDEKTRTLDLQSDLRVVARSVRANAGPVELRLAPRH